MHGPLALYGGQVWDGLAEHATETNLVIDEGTVSGLGADVGAARSIDISGCTVIPGLIEAHAHLCFNGRSDWRSVFEEESPTQLLSRMAGHGQTMLAVGITTVRDLGAPTGPAVQLRDAIASGLTSGPELLVAGAPLTTPGGHCFFLGGEVRGERAVRAAVTRLVDAGVDWIKIMATGGNMTPGSDIGSAQFSRDEMYACVEQAHQLGRPVAAHCHGGDGIRQALAAGADTLEHCSFTGQSGIARDDRLIDEIAARGVVVSPTVNVASRRWFTNDDFSRWSALLRAFVHAECRMVMSTDCGIPHVPHDAFAAAVQLLTDLTQITPRDVMMLATSRSAEGLGLTDRGIIEQGRRADLLILAGNPLEDLSALSEVRYVIKGGTIAHASPPG